MSCIIKKFEKSAKKYCGVFVIMSILVLQGSSMFDPPVIDDEDDEAAYYTTLPVIEDGYYGSYDHYGYYGYYADVQQIPAAILPPLLPTTPPSYQWVQGTSYITPRDLYGTTITDVTPFYENNGFAIQATSPISYAEHFVLDNRIVIDIHNSVPYADMAFYGISDLVYGVRMARQNGFTRVVFDMEFVSNYNIRLNYDRTRLYIEFITNNISYISFHSTYYNDYIVIVGETMPPAFNIAQFLQYTLTVTIPSAIFEHQLQNYTFEGNFFSHIQAQQVDSNVEVVAQLLSDISYTYTIFGNMLTIVIGPPTHRNITFNRADSTIALHNSEEVNVTLENIMVYHYYRDLRHVFILDGDYSDHFGYGTIQFFSPYSTYIDIVTYQGFTSIIVSGANIAFAEIGEGIYSEPGEGYYEPAYTTDAYGYAQDGITIRTFSPREVYDYIVMLDPGHGGEDPGAIHFGYHEADLVLIISNMVYDMLRQNPRVGVFATREVDEFVPLVNRAFLANNVADLFVSIHMNAFYTTIPHGTEVYFWPNYTEYRFNITREQTAEIFQDNLLADLHTFDRGVRRANFTVLRYTEMPSVLLELGFMSNPTDMQMLSNPYMHTVMAQSIYRSIIDVFEVYTPPRQN